MRWVRDIVAGAAVLASGAALVVAVEPSPELSVPARRPATVAPLDATLSCPGSPAGARTSVFAVSPKKRDGAGSLELRSLRPATAAPLRTEEAARVPIVEELSSADGPTAEGHSVVAAASGRRAAGATAYQFSVETGTEQSGLAVSGCDRPADQWWFSGVDTDVGATSRLVLTNPSPGIVVADVLVYGPDGPVRAAGSRGIALAPTSRRSIDLATLAPGLGNAAVQVRTQRGRVVAAIHTTRIVGVTPAGAEWVTPSTSPSTDIVANGGLAGGGPRVLVIANPGRREALVEVRALAESGPFRPTSLSELRVKPGSVLVTDVTAVADRASTSVRLTSTVPVTGGIVSTTGGARPEFAVSTSSPALGAPAVVPVASRTDLTLCANTAERGTGRVAIERVGREGVSLGSDELRVRGGSTTCMDVDASPGLAYLVVSADSADAVHAVATYTGRDGVAAVSVVPGLWRLTRPAVAPAPAA